MDGGDIRRVLLSLRVGVLSRVLQVVPSRPRGVRTVCTARDRRPMGLVAEVGVRKRALGLRRPV